jgi:SagB-type dehydrogenase family enzyme
MRTNRLAPSDSPAPYFDDFTRASELHSYNALQFADQVRSYRPTQRLRTLHTASADRLLHKTSDPHQRLLANRKSAREFSSAPVDAKQLGSLLEGLAEFSEGTRSFPSAGGLYPLEVAVAVANVSGMDRHLAVYHPDTHALGWIAKLPHWDEWKDALGSGVEDEPPVTVFFCIDPSAMVEKYGERGGRFALIEVGHAAQVIAERAVNAKLGGYSVGGLLERATQTLLGFDRLLAPPIPVLAYACGHARPSAVSPDRATLTQNAPTARMSSAVQRLLGCFSAKRDATGIRALND